MSTLKQWLSDLEDDDFIAWANRGLLRRARKLLSDTQALNPEPSFEQAPLSVRVAHGDQQHTVTLAEAGFKHLDCSCDAVGPCQHAICALLFAQDWLQQHPATTTESSDGDHANEASDPPAPATLAPGPWLIDNHVERIKQLGRKELESTTEKLKRGLPVHIQEERNALVGTVIEQQSYRVRIPRNAGLDASLCECGKARCLHRAAVVLKAVDEAGICALEQLPEAPLNDEEQHSLNDSRDWLQHIVRIGLHQLEPHSISRGQALATQVRQSGFPRLAGQLSRLCEVLKQELQAQAAVSTQAISERILDAMILIRALQSEPMPRPRYQLAGVHRREYFQCANLELHCVGLQAWVSSRGMSGLSVHFCDRQQQHWYRYNLVRPPQQYGRFSPQELISSERWGQQTLKSLLGQQIQVEQAWLSVDGSLSGREDTQLEPQGQQQAQVITHWQTLRQRMAEAIQQTPFDQTPRLPVLINARACGLPHFDPTEQSWQQKLYDHSSAKEVLVAQQQGPSRVWLKAMQNGVDTTHWVFGYLRLENKTLYLEIVSLQCSKTEAFKHLSLLDF